MHRTHEHRSSLLHHPTFRFVLELAIVYFGVILLGLAAPWVRYGTIVPSLDVTLVRVAIIAAACFGWSVFRYWHYTEAFDGNGRCARFLRAYGTLVIPLVLLVLGIVVFYLATQSVEPEQTTAVTRAQLSECPTEECGTLV